MRLKVTVNGIAYDVDVEVEEEPQPTLGAIFMTGGTFSPAATRSGAARGAADSSQNGGVRAPLAGTVSQVRVKEGQSFDAGDVLVVLEAMKMETEIAAPEAGTVVAVPVSVGDAVTGGQVLVEIS